MSRLPIRNMGDSPALTLPGTRLNAVADDLYLYLERTIERCSYPESFGVMRFDRVERSELGGRVVLKVIAVLYEQVEGQRIYARKETDFALLEFHLKIGPSERVEVWVECKDSRARPYLAEVIDYLRSRWVNSAGEMTRESDASLAVTPVTDKHVTEVDQPVVAAIGNAADESNPPEPPPEMPLELVVAEPQQLSTPQPIPPWERIPNQGWHRKALELWHDGYTANEIKDKIGSGLQAKTILNVLSSLRRIYGTEVVPERRSKSRPSSKPG